MNSANTNNTTSSVASKIVKPAHKLKARVEKTLIEKRLNANNAISYKREDLLAMRNSAAIKKMPAPMNIPAEIAALHN